MKQRVCDEAVLKVLSDADCSGKALALQGQLDRALYLKVNKVLEALGGKWNRKQRVHMFETDAAEMVESVLLTGEYQLPADFGAFYTPPALANELVEAAAIQPGHSVLEPSAGEGAIIEAIYRSGVQCSTFAIEIRREAVDKLLLLKPPNKTKLWLVAIHDDFLQYQSKDRFDRVVMNPPFSKGQDIEHVLHAFKFLRPGGKLVSVMSGGVLFRSDKRTTEFRQFVESRGGELSKLPENSFKVSGTSVNTVMLVIDKS